MRRLLLFAAIVVVACASLPANKAAEQEILQAESRLAEALNKLDEVTLDSLWDDHLVFVGSNGHATTKAQRLKGIREAQAAAASSRVESVNDDVQVEVLSATSAVAYVVSSWHGMAGLPPQQYRATHVWSREQGAWRLITAHVSKVTP